MKHLFSEIRRVANLFAAQMAAPQNTGCGSGRAVPQCREYRPEDYDRPAYLRRRIVVRRLGEDRWALEEGAEE